MIEACDEYNLRCEKKHHVVIKGNQEHKFCCKSGFEKFNEEFIKWRNNDRA